jgi:hypothetical protein
MQFEAAETAQAAALEAAAHSRKAASWAMVALIVATVPNSSKSESGLIGGNGAAPPSAQAQA